MLNKANSCRWIIDQSAVFVPLGIVPTSDRKGNLLALLFIRNYPLVEI